MKSASVSELKNRLSHYLRLVIRGETVTVLDRGRPVAQLTPVGPAEPELERLAADGLVRLPVQAVTKEFWRRELPHSKASVSQALIEDRADRLR
jgi:prevent-host-death family protein